MIKEKLVVLSGVGMSVESGILMFWGVDGFWEGYCVEDVVLL